MFTCVTQLRQMYAIMIHSESYTIISTQQDAEVHVLYVCASPVCQVILLLCVAQCVVT